MIGQDIAATMPFFQAQADSLQTDTVTVTDPTGYSTPNPTTGVVTPTGTTIYTGPARVKASSGRLSGQAVEAGEARDTKALFVLSVPVTVTAIQPGHIAKVTASSDPDTVGLALRVVAVERGTQITARRMICELVENRT